MGNLAFSKHPTNLKDKAHSTTVTIKPKQQFTACILNKLHAVRRENIGNI